MFTFNDNRFTHMPFAAHDENGFAKEFCCIQQNGLWKLHYFTGTRWKRLKTGLPADATECSPAAEFEDGIWKISFVAGGWQGDRRFRLYRMYGINGEVSAQTFADAGFIWKDRVCYAGRRGPIIIVDPDATTELQLHNTDYIYRISYNPNCPNELLISGGKPDGSVFSWRYHPGLKTLQSITADGVPAYKCAFFDNSCFYARRSGGFEDRHIVRAEHLEFQTLPAGEFITETAGPTGIRQNNPEFE